jgi:serine/threonine protein kinase
MPIEKIGRYQIVAELGKGAMGVVYKATDPNIGRTVALKTMRLDVHGVEPEELLRRFKNEARAAGVLNHPGIVTIYDAGEHDGMFYIAMEYIEGHTLQDLLKREKVLPVEKITGIIRQVCTGLDFAHARGIIHRDIKPANIMIQNDGTAKIMDFGIAKFGGTGMTSTGQVVGTPNYMSPEAVKGRTVDGRSDLFSVGVMLYEMLTGARPFSGETVTTIIYKIVNENPAAPRDLDSAVHPGLSTVVMKALAKAPEQRYRTGADFARDLQNYASLGTETMVSAAVPKPPAPPPPPATKSAPAPGAGSSATAAAIPAPVTPSLDSTVAMNPRPAASARAPAPRKSGLLIGIAAGVVVVVIAIGAFVKLHRAYPPTPPPAAPAEAALETNTPAIALSGKPSATGQKQAPAFGDLQITSTPAGAAVTIDGRRARNWKTPFAASGLKAGRHSVGFSLEGYLPETHQVEVLPGKNLPLDVSLQAGKAFLKAFLTVNSDPPGAQIYIDGRDSGQLTPSRLEVNPGKHRIAVRKQGYKPQVTHADVAAGEIFDFSPAMPTVGAQGAATPDAASQRSANPFRKLGRFFARGVSGDEGVLEVRTRPKGAEIWFGEKQAPSKTPAKFAVAPGDYTLTLRLAGHKPITRSITIEKGKTMGVDEIFDPQ